MLRIEIIDPKLSGPRQLDHSSGPIEFGRGPQRDQIPRCTIEGDYISRNHIRALELPTGYLRVENLSQTNPIKLADGSFISPGATSEIALPARLGVGAILIHIQPSLGAGNRVSLEEDDESYRTISAPAFLSSQGHRRQSLSRLGNSPPMEVLMSWFEILIAVQRAAAGSAEFYEQTARAVVDLVGLDRGYVLLLRNDRWEAVARCGANLQASTGSEFSQTILRRVLEERKTVYQSASGQNTASLTGVEAVVVSPIFDSQDRVLGAVYGCRTRLSESHGMGIGALEAQVVQLLASVVGVGLVRQAREAEAAQLRGQFDQFFSPRLSQELQHNPRLLEGQEREVTVLFSDLRGFSKIAERLGPSETCRLVGEAMDRFTARIREFDGVVVDFAGDGLMAMWNAPADQPDHAELACRAAVGMVDDLPQLSARWQHLVQDGLGLGIGINTGQALVGNVGSKTRFKYGPFGHTVNLASRVEGVTKQTGVSVLITGTTRAKIGPRFTTRRLGRVRVVGMEAPVDLYEVPAGTVTANWLARRDTYERALQLYETSQWAAACQALQSALSADESSYDLPSLDLLARAVACLKSPPASFDPVLQFILK